MKKVALIAGCDAELGRSIAVHFAREGAHLVIVCKKDNQCARYTKYLVEAEGRACILMKGDIHDPAFQQEVVQKVLKKFGKIDILVNNMAVKFPEGIQETARIKDINDAFSISSLAYLQFAKNLLPYLPKNGCIINTSAVHAFAANSRIKAALTDFTELLARRLSLKGIRVNGLVAGFSSLASAGFGDNDAAINQAIQPAKVGPVFVFLASNDAAFINGQVIQVNDQAVFQA